MMHLQPKTENDKDIDAVDSVSLIYLSYNGAEFLEKKINLLINELSVFKNFELIVIDDNSEDDSKKILYKLKTNENIRFIIQSEHKGIPHSMNIGVSLSTYDYVVFCDQRQRVSNNILKQLVEPLKYKSIGAVSACLSNTDKKNKFSFLRSHENFIKSQEDKTGNLIGVYGPLYAIKKKSYSEIPENIILDDLYLTLKILGSYKVRFLTECKVFDEDSTFLYNYKRTSRYLAGFLQLLTEKGLINSLKKKQIVMLIWHKYFRLFIPILLFSTYIYIGILGFNKHDYLILFITFTVFILFSISKRILKLNFGIFLIIRVNLFYFLSFLQITLQLFFIDLFSESSYYIRNLFNKQR